MAKNDKIVGTARLGGKTFVEGDEEHLNALAEEMGVDVSRAYGVDSTEKSRSGRPRTGAQLRSRAIAQRQERDEQAAADAADVGKLLDTPVSELEDALENVNDLDALKRASRRDKRVSAKAVYDRRIEALKGESSDE